MMTRELSDASKLPVELDRCLPRTVRLTGAGWALYVLAIVLLAAAAAVPALLLADQQRKTALRSRLDQVGRTVDAEIVRTGKTKEEHPLRFADYRYSAGDRVFRGRAKLRNSDKRTLALGARLPVRYLPASPERSWVPGYEPRGAPLAAIALIPVAAMATALLLWFAVRRQQNLLAEGRAAVAKVVSVKRVHSDKGSHYKTQFEFRLLSGALKRVTIDTGKKTTEGSMATLLYDRDNPKRAAIYPLSLVRAGR